MISAEPTGLARTLKGIWKVYRVGDHITDEEMKALHKQVQGALPYLTDTLPESYLAWQRAIEDERKLSEYLDARKRKGAWPWT